MTGVNAEHGPDNRSFRVFSRGRISMLNVLAPQAAIFFGKTHLYLILEDI